jgi:hypothetical protein
VTLYALPARRESWLRQFPNHKTQIPSKSETPISKAQDRVSIDPFGTSFVWIFLGIWCLKFGISRMPPDVAVAPAKAIMVDSPHASIHRD